MTEEQTEPDRGPRNGGVKREINRLTRAQEFKLMDELNRNREEYAGLDVYAATDRLRTACGFVLTSDNVYHAGRALDLKFKPKIRTFGGRPGKSSAFKVEVLNTFAQMNESLLALRADVNAATDLTAELQSRVEKIDTNDTAGVEAVKDRLTRVEVVARAASDYGNSLNKRIDAFANTLNNVVAKQTVVDKELDKLADSIALIKNGMGRVLQFSKEMDRRSGHK